VFTYTDTAARPAAASCASRWCRSRPFRPDPLMQNSPKSFWAIFLPSFLAFPLLPALQRQPLTPYHPMIRALLPLLCLLLSVTAYAQDTLVLRNGREHVVKVLEINPPRWFTNGSTTWRPYHHRAEGGGRRHRVRQRYPRRI
jgi:hypothetical protein